jgi:hypothetical protein
MEEWVCAFYARIELRRWEHAALHDAAAQLNSHNNNTFRNPDSVYFLCRTQTK